MFVGRDAEVTLIEAWLEAGERTLVVWGMPGIGKSRLAQEVAERARTDGAVVRVDLAGVRERAPLVDRLAAALGARAGASPGDPLAELGRAVWHLGPALVVLDDVDHPAVAAAALERLGELAPAASFLVTSRRRPALAGSRELELEPLPIAAACELFVELSRRVRPRFEPTAADRPFITEIVTRLDGLPLAIELAALRSAVLSPRALYARLENRFSVLAGGAAPERPEHRSLEVALASAWDGLDARDREVLAALSVFSGSVSADAVEAVTTRGDVLDALNELRARGLLRERPGDDLALCLDASVRAFASQRLDESSRRAELEARHADYFARLAEELAAGLTGRQPALAWQHVVRERENLTGVLLRAARDRALSSDRAEAALRALVALAPALLERGPTAEWVALVTPLFSSSERSGARPSLVAHALAVKGRMLWLSGDRAGGARDLLRALDLARTLGEPLLAGRLATWVAETLLERGEADLARDELARAREVLGGAPLELATAEVLSGEVALSRAELDSAEACFERGLALFVAAGSDWGQARAHQQLSLSACERGDPALALAHATRAEALATGDALSVGRARMLVGLAHHLAGELSRAEAPYLDAEELLGAHGDARGRARTSVLRAALALEQGRPAEAFAGLAAVGEVGEPWSRLEHELSALARGQAMDRRCSAWRGSLVLRIAQATAPDVPPPADALVVAPSARWFRVPGHEAVSLERRAPLARILERLVIARVEAPGVALSRDALQAAGWPSESVQREAGAHRVRVALSTLRKLGLSAVLDTVSEGYLLRPAISVVRAR